MQVDICQPRNPIPKSSLTIGPISHEHLPTSSTFEQAITWEVRHGNHHDYRRWLPVPDSWGGHVGAPVDCGIDGSWIETNPFATDKQIKLVSLPSAGSGDIEWQWIDIAPPGTSYTTDEWHLDVTFGPTDLTNGTSTLDYIVRINNSPLYFRDVTLGSLIGPTNASVTKYVYTVDGGAKGTLLGSLLNSGTLSLPGGYTELFITDVAVSADSTVSAYQNSFRQTPSPLPLLGPGLAAGYLRRLRGLSKVLKPA